MIKLLIISHINVLQMLMNVLTLCLSVEHLPIVPMSWETTPVHVLKDIGSLPMERHVKVSLDTFNI